MRKIKCSNPTCSGIAIGGGNEIKWLAAVCLFPVGVSALWVKREFTCGNCGREFMASTWTPNYGETPTPKKRRGKAIKFVLAAFILAIFALCVVAQNSPQQHQQTVQGSNQFLVGTLAWYNLECEAITPEGSRLIESLAKSSGATPESPTVQRGFSLSEVAGCDRIKAILVEQGFYETFFE